MLKKKKPASHMASLLLWPPIACGCAGPSYSLPLSSVLLRYELFPPQCLCIVAVPSAWDSLLQGGQFLLIIQVSA